MRKVFITGTAGFIGYHLAKHLLQHGFVVRGYDGMTSYYDVELKRKRHAMLLQNPNFAATEAMLQDVATLDRQIDGFAPDIIIHLAAQAGVRYSLEDPRSYVDSNIVGTFNVLEAARRVSPAHLMIASTSSVYGANPSLPFRETDKADHPLTTYAATKKAGEALAHSYAHLWSIPTTMFRFFTVYGTWGRPDLAYFKFVKAILQGEPIDVYNNGDMWRDFTAVADLVEAVRLLVDVPPVRPLPDSDVEAGDSLSPVAPFRVVNIGASEKMYLMDVIAAIEAAVGRKADYRFLPMQKGDAPATWADTGLLRRLTGFSPKISLSDGMAEFVAWYRAEYSI